jgi:FkbM family methyltransferase
MQPHLKDVAAEIEAAVSEGDGWCSLEKALSLASIVIGLRPSVVVELGVWQGGSAIPIAIALRSLGAGQLVAVDAWSAEASVRDQNDADAAWWGETVGPDGHDRAYQSFMRRLRKHGITSESCVVQRECTADAVVPPTIDVLHHDANKGPQVVRDIDRWAPAVRVGGLLILNDLAWQGAHVYRARDRAIALGFVELFPLGTGVVMQRMHNQQRWFRPAFSPMSCYLLRDPEEELSFMRCGGAPEARLIDWAASLVDTDKSFVDVGAHVGTWVQHLARYCVRAHAFEPQRSTYARLCEGVRLAGLDNVACHNVALGARGEAALHIVSVDEGGSTLRYRPELGSTLSVERVQAAQLDDFDLGHVGLIKIDAEGYERDILLGAGRTLAMYRPRLLLEAWTHGWFAAEKEALIDHVKGLGYRVQPVLNWPEMLLAEPCTD